MRLAIFADIHANRQAFTACLEAARAKGAERIVCLGDIVGYGADPEWAVDTVMGLVDDGDRAVLDKSHHGIDRPFRIGAVADDIAEADDPLRTTRPRDIEARAERLPVGMNVRKDGKPHVFLPIHHRARACACLDGYQTPDRLPAAIA